MHVHRDPYTGTVIELTRRNLQALLQKLDFNATGPDTPSACTIEKGGVSVRAVEDVEHYSDHEPGQMLDNASGEMY